MSKVTIEILGQRAWTDGVSWSSGDKALESLLNTMASREITKERFGGYIPDMAQAMAQVAGEALGSSMMVVSIEGEDDQDEDEVIF